jgi:lipoprotein NlpD
MRSWIAVCVILCGCAGGGLRDDPRWHVVRSGDTLYKIATRHGLDARDLARWNGLEDPDMIRVGQRLRLGPPRKQGSDSGARSANNASGGTSTPGTGNRAQAPPPRGNDADRSPPPAVGGRPPANAAPPPANVTRPPSTTTRPPASVAPPQWLWPTDGRVVSTFGSRAGIATGIGISGRAGQVVRAAAGGRIVYAGSGLIGYGQLVIVKHNDTYLTAYGYNSRLFVVQGQDVERGQQIAAMGLGPENTPRLHFEIRRNGVPVDPLPLLSARR